MLVKLSRMRFMRREVLSGDKDIQRSERRRLAAARRTPGGSLVLRRDEIRRLELLAPTYSYYRHPTLPVALTHLSSMDNKFPQHKRFLIENKEIARLKFDF